MERLTKRSENGTGVYNTPSGDPVKWENNRHKVLQKLAEYEDLEEQGKLLKLPCAVGDTVYRVHKGTKLSPDRTYECRVVGVKQEYNTFSVKLYANINEETYSIWVDDWFDRCQIGYEFFLTRKEAEAALKELERGKGE